MPIFLATVVMISRARSIWARVCSLVMMVRMRALPSGTVGKAMPVAITPASKSAREKSMVARPSPMMMGVMGVSLAGVVRPPMSKPAAASCGFEVVGVRPEAVDAFGLVFQNVERGDAGGGDRRRVRGGEQERAGAVVEVVDQVAAAADVAAERADGFG